MAEFLVGILSNIVSVILVGLLVAGWYLTRRRLLLTFFGLRGEKRVVIYPSRLKVQRSLGVDQTPRSFSAMATPEYETKIIADLTAFFEQFTPRIVRLWGANPLLRWGGHQGFDRLAGVGGRDPARLHNSRARAARIQRDRKSVV